MLLSEQYLSGTALHQRIHFSACHTSSLINLNCGTSPSYGLEFHAQFITFLSHAQTAPVPPSSVSCSITPSTMRWPIDIQGVIMPYIPLVDATLLAACHSECVLIPHAAEAVMHLRPGGFADSVRYASKRDRRRWIRERQDFLRNGNVLSVEPVTESLAVQAAHLIAQTRAKYGNRQGSKWVTELLDAQRAVGLLDKAVAFTARRNGTMSAISISFQRSTTLHCRYFGANYQLLPRASEYFEVFISRPTRLRSYHILQTLFPVYVLA